MDIEDNVVSINHTGESSVTPSEMPVKGVISIVIYNYRTTSLARCLDSIFEQASFPKFEVLIMDDASQDGAWDIAVEYARKYKGLISLNRNKRSIGEKKNRQRGLLMCKGEYCVRLTDGMQFEPEYIIEVISRLNQDAFFKHEYICRLKTHSIFQPLYNPILKASNDDRTDTPLVTICIYNFNYGRYLRQCIESVLEQTYQNIEICFSDNASQDDSWNIALEYAEKNPGLFSLSLNRINFGPVANMWNCVVNMRGKYLLKLCSDDAIKPDFIEKCLKAFRQFPDIAYTMVHRDIMDEAGNITPEAPFYNNSCYIPGHEQAAVYMMSSVNPSISQIMYDVRRMQDKRMSGNLNDRWFGDRLMDFHICCEYPIVYLKEPLLLNRIHQENDSAKMDSNLLQCIGEYVLVHQLADIAANYEGVKKAEKRLPEALEKLSNLSIRYCLRRLFYGDESGAKRYFYFALTADLNIEQHPFFSLLSEYWAADNTRKEQILSSIKGESSDVLSRKVSYSPPEDSIQYFDDGEYYASN